MKGLEEALFAWRPPRYARRLSVGVAVAAILALPSAAPAAPPTPGAYREHDYLGFRNILPPAQGANANAAEIAQFVLDGTYPPHNSDQQLAMYHDLMYATPGLSKGQIGDYYKDGSFGVPQGSETATYSPRNDVTIVRDNYGVPHVYASGRAGAMFGLGYATAEDRLFFIDALRHAGRAQLSSFIGGGAGNRSMDASVWRATPYMPDDSELQLQYDRADEVYGARGAQLQHDVDSYVAGVNQLISEACVNPLKLPGEYGLIQPSQSICLAGHEWKVTDVISVGALASGVFGKGGGGELGNAITLQTAKQRFGKRKGTKVFNDFQEYNDPEAPTTIHKRHFHYGQPPKHPRGVAMPDPGTVQYADVVASKSKVSKAAAKTAAADSAFPDLNDMLKPLQDKHSASNALLVSARESKSGHPVAVMGPQVAYFSPQILMEQDVHAPSGPTGPPIDARGTAFPGSNLFVQLGRGRDYAWSATSAGQDIIDTYAVKLCDTGGGSATMDSDGYRFEGSCQPLDVLTRTNSWQPSAADMTPPGSETLTALRSKLGVVIARAKIGGKPYAYTQLRDTYFHEVDPTALGFSLYNNPKKMRSPKDFFRASNYIASTFNWFYADDKHIAYFNSGQNPVRPANVDPNLPTLGQRRFLWKGYDPATWTERIQPLKAHPRIVDQNFLTSWNNRQAPGYNVGYSPLYRSNMLDERIRPHIAGPRKMSLAQLISAMEDAGTVDLRGDHVLPWWLKVIATKPVHNAELRDAIQKLRAWKATGAHRRDKDTNGHYDQTDAVRIMDAWWPRAVEAQFKPALGAALYARVAGKLADDHNRTSHLGSAFQDNAYGIAQKDARSALGAPVRGAFSRVYCGRGKLSKCRKALLGSLSNALQHMSDTELYGTANGCTLGVQQFSADPQECADAIRYRAVGAVTQPEMPWVNRPTWQQAVEIQGHR